MLSTTIADLVTGHTLNSLEVEQLARGIYRYALNLDKTKDLRKLGSNFNIVRPLIEYKKRYLDNTHYVLSRLWRAVFLVYLKQRKCKFCKSYNVCKDKQCPCIKYKWNIRSVANYYKVNYQDIRYILDNNIIMYSDTYVLLKKLHFLNIPNEQEIFIIIDKLINYIRNRVYTKLAFIYNYHNLDAEDFISEIITSITRSLTANDCIQEQTKQIIIAKRIIKQEICNIISRYTAKKRNRLAITSNGYEPILLSLDSDYSNDENHNLHNIVENNLEIYSINSLVKKLRAKVTDEEKLFIDIKTGESIPKTLADYAVCQSGKELNSLKENSTNKIIYSYLGWSNQRVKNFREKIKTILTELY